MRNFSKLIEAQGGGNFGRSTKSFIGCPLRGLREGTYQGESQPNGKHPPFPLPLPTYVCGNNITPQLSDPIVVTYVLYIVDPPLKT